LLIEEGGLAQLARAPALHAGGQRFESVILHETQEKTYHVQRNTYNWDKFIDILEEVKSRKEKTSSHLLCSNAKENDEKKVSKGAWRMPWVSEAKKDVISCDKLR
jgi:hypothetical protein